MIAVLAAGGLIAVGWLSIDTKPSEKIVNPQSVYVIDGDTIDLDGQRIRLVGFDTPEVYSPQCNYEKALGDEATKRLRELIASGEQIELVVQSGKDKYGRGLARLYVGSENVAETMILEGLARPYQGGQRNGWCE